MSIQPSIFEESITWRHVVMTIGALTLIVAVFFVAVTGFDRRYPLRERLESVGWGSGGIAVGAGLTAWGGLPILRRRRQAEEELAAADREFFAGAVTPHNAGGVLGYEVGPGHLPCPGCHRPTDSLKLIGINTVVVYLVYFYWKRSVAYLCCPRCMRGIIVKRMFLNIPTAHLAWPVVAIGHLVAVGKTFRKGHTVGVTQLFAQRPQDVKLVQENRPAV